MYQSTHFPQRASSTSCAEEPCSFHFNKKVAARIGEVRDQNMGELNQLCARLVDLEAQLAAKGKQDTRNVSIRLLKQEISGLKQRIAELDRRQKEGDGEASG